MKDIVYTRAALRALRKHRSMARRIMAKVEDYSRHPESLANVVTDLVGKDCRRLRVGDFRVLFRETPTQVSCSILVRAAAFMTREGRQWESRRS